MYSHKESVGVTCMNAACIKKSMCVVEGENQCRGRENRERVDL